MSKKNKVSSKKNKSKPVKVAKKNSAKKAPVKKSQPKKTNPSKSPSKSKIVSKKNKVKPVISKKAKPAPKKEIKKPAKKTISTNKLPAKTSKPVKMQQPEIKTKPFPAQKHTPPVLIKKEISENKEKSNGKIIEKVAHKINHQIMGYKKDGRNITEYKPQITPTKKSEPLAKESFASTLKQNSGGSLITNPAKKTESYSIKPEKEPAGKFELEFVIRSSSELLYEFLTSPSGLSEWFCDDVNIRNGIYTFVWDGQLQQARLLKTVEEQLVRYQWVDKSDGSYFEFRIQKDELTNDISLIVTDFAGDKGEMDSAKLLWGSQIDKLLHVLGSFF